MNIGKHKACWVAKQYKVGWKLGLAVGENDTSWIKPYFFGSEKDVKKAINMNVVFVHMRGGNSNGKNEEG